MNEHCVQVVDTVHIVVLVLVVVGLVAVLVPCLWVRVWRSEALMMVEERVERVVVLTADPALGM